MDSTNAENAHPGTELEVKLAPTTRGASKCYRCAHQESRSVVQPDRLNIDGCFQQAEADVVFRLAGPITRMTDAGGYPMRWSAILIEVTGPSRQWALVSTASWVTSTPEQSPTCTTAWDHGSATLRPPTIAKTRT